MKPLLRLCFALLFASGTAAQAATVDLSLVPQHSTHLPGDTFNVEVVVALADGDPFWQWDGGSFQLTFDPAVLDATGFTMVAPWGPLSGTPPLLDNTAGLIQSGGLGSLAGIADGVYTMARIAFLAQAPGLSVLGLSEDLSSPFSTGAFPADVVIATNGSVNVVPIPAAAWLMLSGAAFLGLIGRRRRAGRQAV